jgi:hypothetical protein
MMQFNIKFLTRHRKARIAPDPAFPKGRDIDPGTRPACRADLPYPAECVGTWVVKCGYCGCTVAITAAGRPDDPKSLMIPCKRKLS